MNGSSVGLTELKWDVRINILCGVSGVGDGCLGFRMGGGVRGPKSWSKTGRKHLQKLCFRGRQVGAFSVFGQGVYRNPVHKIGKKGLFFGKLTDLGVDVI